MTSEQHARRRRRWRIWLLSAAIVAAALGAAVVIPMGQPLTLALSLAVPTTESWLARVRADPVVEETSIDADGRRIAADVYRPAAPRAGLLLVHGLSPAGRRHPELVRLARLLARHDRLVLVPHFEGLAAFRLSGREVAEIRAALRALAARQRPIGVAGLSFGAGPALLAAADVPDVTLAASFGGYADLYQVIRYLTTGTHDFGDRRYTRPPEEYNRWKLLALLVEFVRDDRDRRVLDALATRKLADPGADTRALEADLGAAGRAVLALVLNRRDDAVGALVAALPGEARATVEQLSPLGAVARLRGRLVIAHGARDVSIPFTESLRLAEASAGRAHAVILETFEHTTQSFWPALGSRMRDVRRLLSLTEALLAEPIDS
jgi:pimeloyl-ACP methyl ester carboxylesterase